MPNFKDSKDREWAISLQDARMIQKIREDCDPHFMLNDFNDLNNNTFKRLQGDPVLLCRVMYLLCEKQRLERNLSEEDFYLGVIGDAIDRATDALIEAMMVFARRSTRDLLEALVRQEKLQQAAFGKITEKMDALSDTTMIQHFEKEIDERFLKLMTQLSNVTDTPESSESLLSD